MGCCLSNEFNQGKTVIKGKPYKQSNLRWTSEVPITRSTLKKKRTAFWETTPFYEGRPEIWQVIQEAINSDNIILTQSILDGANLKLPTGNPNDGIYDEYGHRYKVPLYCLVDPTNILPDDQVDVDHQPQHQQNNSVTTCHNTDNQSYIVPSSAATLPTQTSSLHHETINNVLAMMGTSVSTPTITTLKGMVPGDLSITVRLSTGKDISIMISSSDETVPLLKLRITDQAHLTPDTHTLRLIHLGKILDDDTSIIGDFTLTSTPPLESNTVKLRTGAVIHAVVIAKDS
ncbi:hypothetical protein BC941DRAFT_433789 [Chlamydoabsidia padenii]|nr:hypothetical protein BC941DRAFT_433789 [Chlamydoabsidia padenii]